MGVYSGVRFTKKGIKPYAGYRFSFGSKRVSSNSRSSYSSSSPGNVSVNASTNGCSTVILVLIFSVLGAIGVVNAIDTLGDSANAILVSIGCSVVLLLIAGIVHKKCVTQKAIRLENERQMMLEREERAWRAENQQLYEKYYNIVVSSVDALKAESDFIQSEFPRKLRNMRELCESLSKLLVSNYDTYKPLLSKGKVLFNTINELLERWKKLPNNMDYYKDIYEHAFRRLGFVPVSFEKPVELYCSMTSVEQEKLVSVLCEFVDSIDELELTQDKHLGAYIKKVRGCASKVVTAINRCLT